MTVTWRLAIAAVLTAAGLLVGITQLTGRQAERTTPTAVAPKLPSGPLAAPTGETVLTIEGVARGNTSTRTTELDYATLDALAREKMTVREPFLKRKMTFTGVRLGAFLQRAGIADSTRGIYMHALDDYHVELPYAKLQRDALLATRAGGRPIPIADGGPVRVIYPDGSELGAITDNWIWSVDSIAAR